MELERDLIILENRESGRGRIVNVLARRVGESVWEGGFGAEVFWSVWLCEKMLNKMWPFNSLLLIEEFVLFYLVVIRKNNTSQQCDLI